MKLSMTILVLTLLLGVSFLPAQNETAVPLDQRIKNLESFCRLYGYVRYFYPGDEAAALDWGSFAAYGAKFVENAENPKVLKKKLNQLFSPIAPVLVIHDENSNIQFSKQTITPPDKKNMNVISWQHLGVGFGNPSSIYKSQRLYRDSEKDSNGVGNVMSYIDATPYYGKNVKFRAAVKTTGEARLWLRVDRQDGESSFFENMEKNPIKKNQWKYYEISGPVAKDAYSISFGVMLMGRGENWSDDFQLFVQDKKDAPWKPVDIKNPGFEDDEIGEPPKHWRTTKKFYEQFDFKVTDTTAAKGKRCVHVAYDKSRVPGQLFAQKAAFGDYILKKLGNKLAVTMPVALYGTADYTYPKAPKEKLQQLLAKLEKAFPAFQKEEIKKIEADLEKKNPKIDKKKFKNLVRKAIRERKETLFKVWDLRAMAFGDVIIAWNVFQHFYPYHKTMNVDWNAALTEALEAAYTVKDKRRLRDVLAAMTAHLKDGHVRVNLRNDSSVGYLPPIKCKIVEGQLVLTHVFDPTLDRLKPGDVFIKMDGVDTQTLIKKESRLISAATKGWMKYRLCNALLRGGKNSDIKLTVQRGKEVFTFLLPRSTSIGEYYKKYYKKGNPVHYNVVEPGIYYLNLDVIEMKEITRLMPQLEKADGIICDLRGYPNSNHGLIPHLMKPGTEDNAEWMHVPKIILPDYQKVTFKHFGWNIKPAEPHLTAKIVFILNGGAISYAESYMGYIEEHKLATIIGEASAGSNGNVNPFLLPGGYYITWTGMYVTKHDGKSQHHGKGIVPHIPLQPTINGIRQGRDELLEKAIEIIKK